MQTLLDSPNRSTGIPEFYDVEDDLPSPADDKAFAWTVVVRSANKEVVQPNLARCLQFERELQAREWRQARRQFASTFTIDLGGLGPKVEPAGVIAGVDSSNLKEPDELVRFFAEGSGWQHLKFLMRLQKKGALENLRLALEKISHGQRLRKQERVLERLDGFVDQIDGDVAFVTLTSESGDVLHGEFSAADLAAKGIRECRRFKCTTVAVDESVRIDLEPIPEHQLTPEEVRAIVDQIDEIVSRGNLDGDY